MTSIQILYIVVIKTGRDKTYGNSYSSARVTSVATGRTVGYIPIEQGSFGYCEQVTLGWIKVNLYKNAYNNRIHCVVIADCKKKDVRSWGVR